METVKIIIYTLSFERRHGPIRFEFAFYNRSQIWNSPENITFMQQQNFVVSVHQIVVKVQSVVKVISFGHKP